MFPAQLQASADFTGLEAAQSPPPPPIFICLNCDLSVPVSAPNPRRSQWPRFNSNSSSSIMPSAAAKARQLRVKFCWYSGRYLLSLPVSSLSPWSHQQSLFLPCSALSSHKKQEFSSFRPGFPRLWYEIFTSYVNLAFQYLIFSLYFSNLTHFHVWCRVVIVNIN